MYVATLPLIPCPQRGWFVIFLYIISFDPSYISMKSPVYPLVSELETMHIWHPQSNSFRFFGPLFPCLHLATEIYYYWDGIGWRTVPRFGQFCSCCCLPLLPQLACNILATWERLFSRSLYKIQKASNYPPASLDVICECFPISTPSLNVKALKVDEDFFANGLRY